MSPWSFGIYMDGYIRELKASVGTLGINLIVKGVGHSSAAGQFADDRIFSDDERMRQRFVGESDRVCKKKRES